MTTDDGKLDGNIVGFCGFWLSIKIILENAPQLFQLSDLDSLNLDQSAYWDKMNF